VSDVNDVAANENTPAAVIGEVAIDHRDKAEREQEGQRPHARTGQQERGGPGRDVSKNFVAEPNRTLSRFPSVGLSHSLTVIAVARRLGNFWILVAGNVIETHEHNAEFKEW